MFRKLVEKAGLASEFEIDSAGTEGYHVGEHADSRAIACASARGYDMSAHIARKVHPSDFSHYDYILAMDWKNIDELRRYAPPGLLDKVQLLMRYSTSYDVSEVPDPYYGNTDGFQKVLLYCEDACHGLLSVLTKKGLCRPKTL